MSVYGNMILENYKSIEDICNDINITCLEFNNYSTFLDEYVLNENFDIINEGVVDVIGKGFCIIKMLY